VNALGHQAAGLEAELLIQEGRRETLLAAREEIADVGGGAALVAQAVQLELEAAAEGDAQGGVLRGK